MNKHNFQDLYNQYPNIIRNMPSTFTAHQFILELAHKNQVLYIKALNSYCDVLRKGNAAPFQMVHGILAQKLLSFPELINYINEVDSQDIFGQPQRCSQWGKIQ